MRNVSIDDRAHLSALGVIEKKPSGSDELERVPFDWIVARRDGKSAGGVVMLDGKLDSWRRCNSDVHDVAPCGFECAQHHAVDQCPRHSTVASDDYDCGVLPRSLGRPRSPARCEAG